MTLSNQEGRFWDQLLQALDDGRVIAVVGRDLLELPPETGDKQLYPYLARRLAAYLGVDGESLPAGSELTAVACRHLDSAGHRDLEDIYSGLKSIMREEGSLPVPEPLLQLAEIEPLKLFVSTTFDSMLRRALDTVRFGGRRRTQVLSYSPSSVVDLPCEMARLERPTVFHLFGKASAVPDYAVTDEDVLEFMHSLRSDGRRAGLLFDELRRQQLLILGCSYPDWLARFFFRSAAGQRLLLARGTIFVADSRIHDDRPLVDFLEHFSTRTRVFGGSAVDFVRELNRRWKKRTPSDATAEIALDGTLLEEAMEPGAVFLSYARQDIEVVEGVRDALERAGIAVWFDKRSLQGGDPFEQTIRRNIESCSVFVPFISRETLTAERRFFRLEWSLAERVAQMAPASQRFIVPVAIDDTEPSEPTIPDSFRSLHWERLPGGRPTPELVGGLRSLFRAYHKAHRALG